MPATGQVARDEVSVKLSPEERIEFCRAVMATFRHCHHDKRLVMSNSEYELARKWAAADVPLATVLQGIAETAGKPRRLEACERSVQENISRWHRAMGGLP